MKHSFLLILLLLSMPVLVSGHGSTPDNVHQTEMPTLSLEMIFLITLLFGLGILFVLSEVIGIRDRALLLRMAAITLMLLVIDYTYIRYFR